MLSTERGTDRPPSVSLESPSFQHCRFCQPPESICSPGASKNIDSSWKRFNTNLGTFSFSFPWWQLSWQHEAKHDCCWNGDLKKKKKMMISSWWFCLGMSGRDVAHARMCNELSRGRWAHQIASMTGVLGLGCLLCLHGIWVLAYGHLCFWKWHSWHFIF